MFLAVHSTVGALIGTAVSNPAVSFILGMASHFLLDRIPHLDPDVEFQPGKIQFTKPIRQFIMIAFFDSLIVLAFTLFLLAKPPVHPWSLLAGIAGSVFPDYVMGLAILTDNKYLRTFQRFHKWCHFDKNKIPVNLYTGSLTQIATWIVAVYFIAT